jgi:hypothetical protein
MAAGMRDGKAGRESGGGEEGWTEPVVRPGPTDLFILPGRQLRLNPNHTLRKAKR